MGQHHRLSPEDDARLSEAFDSLRNQVQTLRNAATLVVVAYDLSLYRDDDDMTAAVEALRPLL